MARPVVLQVGFGNFGRTHLAAWTRLGLAAELHLVDPDPAARKAARAAGLPESRVGRELDEFLDLADIVDIVSATDTHLDVCLRALAAGKDVAIEKPMAADLDEARRMAGAVAQSGRCLQVGFYFRFHPLGLEMKRRLASGSLGDIRYLGARFSGFKRARGDSGVLLNDVVHFIDLQRWLLGESPEMVRATLRDHFQRGFDDMAFLEMSHASGAVARIEAGCTLPGRWMDDIVAGATASKTIEVIGSEGALEVDFVRGTLLHHEVRHDWRDGLWRPSFGETRRPHLPTAGPIDVVTTSLGAFLESRAAGRRPEADAISAGVEIARILDAAQRSAATGRAVELEGRNSASATGISYS